MTQHGAYHAIDGMANDGTYAEGYGTMYVAVRETVVAWSRSSVYSEAAEKANDASYAATSSVVSNIAELAWGAT